MDDIAHVLTIENSAFLITKTAESVPGNQYLRELTENAIQAGSTEIRWDVDRWHAQAHPSSGRKLCIIDDGAGMDGDMLVKFIGGFASSGRTQAGNANFGVGAKFAAGVASPTGVVYRSWTSSGDGWMCKLIMNIETQTFGLAKLDATGSAIARVPFSEAPELIRKAGHGTVVTLVGEDFASDTVDIPGLPGSKRWVGHALSSRYMFIRPGVSVWVPEVRPESVSHIRLIPQLEYLESRSTPASRGIFETEQGYEVLWWLLDEKPSGGSRETMNAAGAQFGVILSGETYSNQMFVGAKSRSWMHRFGIRLGSERVALYVQPKPSTRASANLQRTRVELPGGEELPLEDIADEFVRNMPETLAAYVRAKSADVVLDTKALEEKLTHLLDQLGVGRYRRSANGKMYVDADDIGLGGNSPAIANGTTGSAPGGTTGSPAGGTGDATTPKSAGDRAKSLPLRIPSVVYCSADPLKTVGALSCVPLSEAGDELEDRAAMYSGGESATLYINLDFRAYLRMEEALASELLREAEQQQGPAIVRPAIVAAYTENLLEAVLTAQMLSRSWEIEERRSMLAPEALTMAALQRSSVMKSAKERFSKQS